MSMELHVFLARSRLPDVLRWQAAIDSHGFDVKLHPNTNVGTDSGYLPAVFKGRESGFEFDVMSSADLIDAYPDIAARVSGLETVGNFRWGSDLNEMACALAAAAALTSLSGGVFFDPYVGECCDAAGAIKEAELGIKSVNE